MATNPTTTEMAIKPQVLDYAVIENHKTTKNEDGTEKTEVEYTAITGKELIAKAEAAGKLKFKQSITWDDAVTDAGIAMVLKNEKDRVAVFNAGLKSSRINPRVKRLLEKVVKDEATGEEELDFEPVAGYYDIRALLNQPAERRTMTDTERAVAALMPLFPNKTEKELLQLLEVFRASGASIPGYEASAEGDGEGEEQGEEQEVAG